MSAEAQGAGYLVRCTVCGRESRTGRNPLRDGWPKCCGYTMRLEDNEAFKADIERAMGEDFAPALTTQEAEDARASAAL